MECLLSRRVNPQREKGNCLLGDGGEGRMKRTHANESTGSNLTVFSYWVLCEGNENCASYNAIKLTPFTKIRTFFSYLNAAWFVASLWFISRLPEKLIWAMFTSVLIVFTDFRESLLQHFKMFSLCLFIYKLIQLNKMRRSVSHLTLVMFLFEANLIFLSGLLS